MIAVQFEMWTDGDEKDVVSARMYHPDEDTDPSERRVYNWFVTVKWIEMRLEVPW